MSEVVEWAPFRLRPGVPESEIIAASRRVQEEFLAGREGFLRRDLVKAQDSGYVDIVWWSSKTAAEAAMHAIGASEACSAYFSLMDFDPSDPAAMPQHFDLVGRYG